MGLAEFEVHGNLGKIIIIFFWGGLKNCSLNNKVFILISTYSVNFIKLKNVIYYFCFLPPLKFKKNLLC